jgi:hypothetical protein
VCAYTYRLGSDTRRLHKAADCADGAPPTDQSRSSGSSSNNSIYTHIYIEREASSPRRATRQRRHRACTAHRHSAPAGVRAAARLLRGPCSVQPSLS